MKYGLIVLAMTVCAVMPLCAQNNVVFRTPQEAVNYYEKLIGTLMQRVSTMQDDNAQLQAAVADLQRKVSALAASNQTMQQEVATLKKQVSADSAARSEQLEKIATRIQAASQSGASTGRSAGGSTGEYVEYTVQAGATLSAISKAYGVSISEIKRANKMNSDVLRVGQKLLIPAK